MESRPDRASEAEAIIATLREERDRLRALIECIPAAISMKDLDGRYLWINRRFADAHGLDPGGILGRTDDDLFPPDVAARRRADDREALEAGQAIDHEEMSPWAVGPPAPTVRTCPLRDADGAAFATCGVAFEAGGGRAELALRESERRVGTILESIADGFYALDSGWRFVYVNAQAEAMLGRPRDELLGRVVWREFPEAVDTEVFTIYRRAVAEGVPVAFEVDYPPLGRRFSVHAYPLEGGLSVYFTDATERYRAELALRESERRVVTILESIADGFIAMDSGWRFVYINAQAEAMLGRPRGELLGRVAWEEFPAGVGSVYDLHYRRAVAEGVPVAFEVDYAPLGRRFSVHAYPLEGGLSVYFTDATERYRAELALRESERRMVTILESIADGFIAMDASWRFVYINAQAEAMLGRPRGELLGRVAWEEFPEAVGTELHANYLRAVAEGVPVSFEIDYAPLGRRFDVHAYPIEGGLSVYHTDITDRYQSEIARQGSERRFRLVMENSRDVIYQLNLDTGTYDYASPSSLNVLGYTPEELAAGGMSRTASSLHPADHARLQGHLDRLLRSDPEEEIEPVLEYRVRVPGKGWRWMSDSRALVRDAGGRPTSIVGTVRDVTDRREAENRLRDLTLRLARAQEEERGRIARELHDEIGSALTAIKLNLRGMQKATDPSANPRRLAEAVALVERTIGQVRDISLDLRPPILDDIGLVEALRSLVAGFGRRTGIPVQFAAQGGRPPTEPDVETACYRIAQEALTNVVRHAGARRVRVELTATPAGLGLEVGDDGAGFDVEAMTARAAGGFSLGVLSMSERAALVGGRVEIRSEAGRGTVVRAHLPMGGGRVAGDLED
ncbi:PAS domain-containing protein [Tundrisphaera sp. TA3]|uniref:PAS domain-containing protein n=1 Tax=Tundrisphaera sp. TA3 TaxID=3435775 RepID=UPI003EB79334